MAKQQLKEFINTSKELAEGLKRNALCHINYIQYTSMEKALSILVTGYLYLSNGKNWNDVNDEKQMCKSSLFGLCFSHSTEENVAMWMLYSGNNGRNGVSLNFKKSMLCQIINNSSIEIGRFQNGLYEKLMELKEQNGYKMYLTDILYVTETKKDSAKITWDEQHLTRSNNLLANDEILIKSFPWSYEKESRLIVKFDEQYQSFVDAYAETVRVKLPKSVLTELKKRITKSPVYSGTVDFGSDSKLKGEVKWNI